MTIQRALCPQKEEPWPVEKIKAEPPKGEGLDGPKTIVREYFGERESFFFVVEEEDERWG